MIDYPQLLHEMQEKNRGLRTNISALDKRITALVADRDRAEQAERDMRRELDHLKREFDAFKTKALSMGVTL